MNKLHKRFRLVGLVIGLIGAVGFTCYSLFAKGHGHWYGIVYATKEVGVLGFIIFVPIFLFLFASVALTWKWQLFGSLLLISEGIVLIFVACHMLASEASLSGFSVMFAIGLSLVISGALYYRSWREERKHRSV